ncbi:hypothetical protein ASF10_23260 [Flavobacterium sp. Leaf82]|nr:hypothetical protein ASF10_23260 [Flavobacterium sp. Leaf82]
MLFISNLIRGQDDVDNEWIMQSGITKYIPVDQKWIELCKTDEGKKMILESLDPVSKFDLKLQYRGIRMQDSLQALATGKEFLTDEYKSIDQFYLEHAEAVYCTAQPGGQHYTYENPNKKIFKIDNTFYCVSANTGGGNENDCNVVMPLLLPEGWQVCKFFYDGKTKRHGKFRFEPIFRKDDSQNPPRVLGHTLFITGHGDRGNVSSAYIKNIKVYAIKSNLQNDERIKCDCDMPVPLTAPAPIPQQPTSKPDNAPAKISYGIMDKSADGHSAFFVIRNEGGKTGIVRFKIVYRDKYSGQWKRYEEGDIAINPNEVISKQMTIFDANDWKFEYDGIVDMNK